MAKIQDIFFLLYIKSELFYASPCFLFLPSLPLWKTFEMEKSTEQSVNRRLFRFAVPYTDTVDMARKILQIYNGYLVAIGKKQLIDARHMNLLSYYFVFGYSYDTKQKFATCYSTSLQYVSVLDTEMKKRGFLVDRDGNYRSRGLSPDLENMRRLFVLEGSKDVNAIISVFHRVSSGPDGEEG